MVKFTEVKDIANPFDLAQKGLDCKRQPFNQTQLGAHKTIALLFFNPSLRTRLSTQKAAMNLGLSTMVMDMNNHGWKLEFEDGVVMDGMTAEHIKEGAAVISQYCDILAIRTFPTLTDRTKDYQEHILSQFIKHARVPVVSLESATRHPLQSLTDLMTIQEMKKVEHPKVVLTWAPHPKALPQAVANSFAEWMLAADMDLTITHPEGYALSNAFTAGATIEYDVRKAYEGADFIYAKNWSAYHTYGSILSQDKNWLVDQAKMEWTNDAYFMHCLPVRRNVVVADAVIDSSNSLVIQQANNRTFAAQAVLQTLLENG